MRRSLDRTFGKWKKQKDAIVSLDAAISVLGSSFQGLSSVLRQTITASAAQQTGINELNRSFGQLGLDVPSATTALEAFAAEQQRTTRFADDQTRAIAAQFGRLLAGTETSTDEIIALTALVQDAVEATGKGAEEVTAQLAQVYSGNVEAIGELIPAQREAINAIRETEGAAAAASAAFELMSETFGGAAENIDPFEQQVARLQNSFSDLLESLGDRARSALESSGVLSAIQDALDDMIYWVETNGDSIEDWVYEIANAFGAVASGIIWALDKLNELVEARARFRAEEASSAISDELQQRENANILERMRLEGHLGHLHDLNRERVEMMQQAVQAAAGHSFRLTAEMRDAGFESIAQLQAYGTAITMAAAAERGLSTDEVIGQILTLREEYAALRIERDALSESLRDTSQRLGEGEFEGLEFTAGEGGDGPTIDPDVFRPPREVVRSAGFGSAMEWWEGFVEGFGEALDEAGEQIAQIIESGEAILAKEGMGQKGADIGMSFAEGLSEGLGVATSSMQMFAAEIPVLMEKGAENGVAKFAAVMRMFGAAASLAATVGANVDASTKTWAPLLSQFFGLAAASATFAVALGAAGGGGGTPQRGASGADTGDILTGVRPEAARTGQARVINLSIGAVMNNDETRRSIADAVTEAELLGEIRRAG